MNIKGKQPVVIFQTPNAPLIVWLVCLVASHVFINGFIYTIFVVVGFIAIVVWAIWEILDGANIFRRLLGLVVLIFVLANRF